MPKRASLTAAAVAALRALASGSSAALVDPEDAVALELLPRPLRLALRPLLASKRARDTLAPQLARLSLGLADHIALRSAYIDGLLRAELAAGCTQVVILGAGLDSRALRMPELHAARVFELDRAQTQRVKRARSMNLPRFARVLRFVAADLGTTRFAHKLAEAGHDRQQRSVLIVEGVLPYLPPETRPSLLAELAVCAAPGSLLIASYVTPDQHWLERAAPLVFPALRAIGEPLLGPVRPEALARELRAGGFTIERDGDTLDWARELAPYAPRAPLLVYERVVVARRSSRLA